MATAYFVGAAVAVRKRLIVRPGSDTVSFTGNTVQIGLGTKLLSFNGFNPAAIAEAWNASTEVLFKEITAEAVDGGVAFTHKTPGQDFELTVKVDNRDVQFASEVHVLSFQNNVTGGTFTLTIEGQTTTPISYVANDREQTAQNIADALEALPNIGIGDVQVTAVNDTTFTLDWGYGQYAGLNLSLPYANYDNLTGGTASVSVTTIQHGSPGVNEIQRISMPGYQFINESFSEIQEVGLIGNPVSGTFTLTLDGFGTTGAIPYNATAQQLQTALQALLGPQTVTCTGGPLPGNRIRCAFTGALNGIDLPEMTGDASGLQSEQLDVTVTEHEAGEPDTDQVNHYALPSEWAALFPDTADLEMYFVSHNNHPNVAFKLKSATISGDSSATAIRDALLGDWNYVSGSTADLDYGKGPGRVFQSGDLEVTGTLATGFTVRFKQFWNDTLSGPAGLIRLVIAPKPGVSLSFPVTEDSNYNGVDPDDDTWDSTDPLLDFRDQSDTDYAVFTVQLPHVPQGFSLTSATLRLTQASAQTDLALSGTVRFEQNPNPTFPASADDARLRQWWPVPIASFSGLPSPGQNNVLDLPVTQVVTARINSSWTPGNRINLRLHAGHNGDSSVVYQVHSKNATTESYQPRLLLVPSPVVVGTVQTAWSPGTRETQLAVCNSPLPTEGAFYLKLGTVVTDPISLGGLTGTYTQQRQQLAARMQTALTKAIRVPNTPPPEAVTFHVLVYRPTGTGGATRQVVTKAVIQYPVNEANLRAVFGNVPIAEILKPDQDVLGQPPLLRLLWVREFYSPTIEGSGSGISTYAGLAAALNALIQTQWIDQNRGGYLAVSNQPVTVTWVSANSGVIPAEHFQIVYQGWSVQYTDLPLLEFLTTASGNDSEVEVTTIQNGGVQEVPTITGGFYTLLIRPVNSFVTYTVPEIPWNATAAQFASLVNGVLGAGSVVATGGPHPTDPITFEFTGPFAKTPMHPTQILLSLQGRFGGEVTTTVLRPALRPTRTDNVWDFILVPGYGTLALDSAEGDYNYFSLKITTPQGVVVSNYFRWPNMTAKRLEGVINEMFGKEVCKVYQIVHSQEWAEVNHLYGTPNAQTRKVWYFRDVFRIVFHSDYADPASITSIEAVLPQIGDPLVDVGPAQWMIVDTVSNYDDFTQESRRVAEAFIQAAIAGNPLHVFQFVPADATSTLLAYRFKFISHYFIGMQTQTPRAYKADFVPDMKVRFHWKRFAAGGDYATGLVPPLTEQTQSETITSTGWLDWDSPAEVIQYALESMTAGWFGPGNVRVTGSLMNSWLPETATPGISVDGYNDLRVVLQGRLAELPLDDLQYHLSMELGFPYLDSPNTDFAPPVVWRDVICKPIPPLRSERQRVTISDMAIPATIQIGYGGEFVTAALTDTASEVETRLNSLPTLGAFPSTVPLTALPVKYRKAVTVYGRTLKDGLEIEFNGYGFQFSDTGTVTVGVLLDTTSIMTVETIQDGIATRQEIQRVSMHGRPWTGTFQLTFNGHQTAPLPRTADAHTIGTAVAALPGITSVTATGGPLLHDDPTAPQGPVFLTFGTTNLPQLGVTGSTLRDVAITVTESRKGGQSGSLVVLESVRGSGPQFWDSPDNWSTGQVPSSGDIVIIDDARSPIRFGLRQRSRIKVDILGPAARLLHANPGNRRVFLSGMRIYVYKDPNDPDARMPTGLTEDTLYYVRNSHPNGSFQLSTTPDGPVVAITDIGEGQLFAEVRNLTLKVYARFGGQVIGLPNFRSNGEPEYLARYLEASFATGSLPNNPGIELGIEEGPGLTLGRFHTGHQPTTIRIRRTGTSSDPTGTAVLLLSDSLDTVVYQEDGECGIAMYADESSKLKRFDVENGLMVVGHCILKSTEAGGGYRVKPGATLRTLHLELDGQIIQQQN